jgi:quinol monooxygenase YgiN
MSIYFRVEVKVNDGKIAEFEQVAKALVAGTADEPGTLSYRLFSDAPGNYTFIEEYVDAAGSAAHGKAARELLGRLGAVGEITRFEIFGGEADGVEQVAAAIPTATVHRQVF